MKCLFIFFLMSTVNTAFALDRAAQGFQRYPDIHGESVVFTSSGDLWLASVNGGSAVRITAHEGEERFPHFSTDGKWIAFSGNYYGNEDVFVMPRAGGEPLQLTFLPISEQVVGWDEAGYVLYRSRGEPPFFPYAIYRVSPDGGFPEKLPYARAAEIAFEPGGERVALVPTFLGFHPWKRYKGGWAEKIWVGSPAEAHFERISTYQGNESSPMWNANGRIYFTSDTLGRANIWSMQPAGTDLRPETNFDRFDVRWPNMNGNDIVFQNGMDLWLYNVESHAARPLQINVPTDLYVARTKFVDPAEYITSWSPSRDGKRLLVAARGEIFTLPVMSGGLIRQWTYSSGSREKHPLFLPDASKGVIAVSDVSGEDALVRLDVPGAKPQPALKTPQNGWKYAPSLSPDGKYAAYGDYSHQLLLVDLSRGQAKVIDTGSWEITDYGWSPDSRYLAYSRWEDNNISTLRIYDNKTGSTHLISDARFTTNNPAWDPSGRYLYCVTERSFNGFQDYDRALFFYDHTATLALFRLNDGVTDPFAAKGDAPTADRLPGAAPKDDDDNGKDTVAVVDIDFTGLENRMIPFPLKPGNYSNLAANGDKLYYISTERGGRTSGVDLRDYTGPYLMLYDLVKRESIQVASKVRGYSVSADGKVIVVRTEGGWYHGEAGAKELITDDEHRVSTDGWRLEVTPREEWRQILREAWRQQRDFFYAENLHGVAWAEVLDRYGLLIDRVATRDDLRDLIREIQGELHAGHAYIGPGDEPKSDPAPVGLLGVDMRPDPQSGFYIITRVLNPEPGTADGSSPLVNADPKCGSGTYILAIDGRPVRHDRNILRLLQDKAEKEVALTLNEKPALKGSREVVVKTMKDENRLRYLDWVRAKREYVDERSGGRLGYVHLLDMGGTGLSQIGRDYYPQRTRAGMIIDDRFNGGGNIAEYFLQILDAEIWAFMSARRGVVDWKPHGAYFGHVAVLCNEETFSDGESFAEGTKRLGIGKLIGTRTWGGWVWIRASHPLVDNAFVSEPEFGGWGLDGEWLIEGHGVDPDIEVVNDPGSELRGEDRQLDTAIQHLLEKIHDDPREFPPRPDDPVKR